MFFLCAQFDNDYVFFSFAGLKSHLQINGRQTSASYPFYMCTHFKEMYVRRPANETEASKAILRSTKITTYLHFLGVQIRCRIYVDVFTKYGLV